MVTAISKSPRRPVDVGKATSPDIFPNPGSASPRVPIVGRAAIYTRVSTDRQQDGASLEVQLESCRRYCESMGLHVVAEFRDVLSGLNPDRPQYQQAVALATSNGVDKLIVWRLDRLGRDLAEYATQLRNLKRQGVDVVSVTQPGESVMMQQIAGVFAEQESRDKGVRVAASKLQRAKQGKWNGKAPLGYDRKKHPDGGYVLVPNREAPLIKELFALYAAGNVSLYGLTDFLNNKRHRVLTRAAVWNLLKNPAYIGMVRHGKWSHSKFTPKPEVTLTKGLHPVIVDAATFEKVQARLKSNSRIRGKAGLKPSFLFAGLVYCGNCGRRYTGHRNPRERIYYYCNRKVMAGDCTAGGIDERRIREVVLGPLDVLFGKLQKDKLRKLVRDELRLQEAAIEATEQVTRAELEAAHARLNMKLTRIEDLYLDGTLSKDRYLERREGTQTELEAIKAQLAARPKALRPDTDQLFAIADALNETPPDDQEWREIVAEMVERVVIGKTVEVHWKPLWQPVIATVIAR
jgi:site-specific DNA recombinase